MRFILDTCIAAHKKARRLGRDDGLMSKGVLARGAGERRHIMRRALFGSDAELRWVRGVMSGPLGISDSFLEAPYTARAIAQWNAVPGGGPSFSTFPRYDVIGLA